MSGSLRYDFKTLANLVKSFEDKSVIRIGILSNKKNKPRTKDSKNDNAYLGRLHEYGSFERHIPARSWLRMPITVKSPQIMKSEAKNVRILIKQGKMVLAKKRIGIACEVAIQEAFDSAGFGTWAANRPSTIKRKGSAQPLIDTGQLRRAVSSEVVSK